MLDLVGNTYLTSWVSFSWARERRYRQLSILGPMTANSCVQNALGGAMAEMAASSAPNC